MLKTSSQVNGEMKIFYFKNYPLNSHINKADK